MKQITLIVLGWAMMASLAQAASFDCAKAGTKVEHLICDNPEISKLDEELSAAYKELLDEQLEADEVNEAKESQRKWLKGRNSCGDTDCLRRYYDGRLYLFTGRFDPNSVAFKYRMVVKSDMNICGQMLDRMNEEFVHGRPACPYDLLASIPGVAFPEWKKLDMEENKQLNKRFLLAYLVKEEFYIQVFGGPGGDLDVKRLPTKEQMNSDGIAALSEPGTRWAYPKSGTRMVANDLEGLWSKAVKSGNEFYRWDGALLPPNDMDVLLVEVSRFDVAHKEPSCPQLRLLRISAGLRMPSFLPTWERGYAKWTIGPEGIPFQYENQYFLLWHDSPFNTFPRSISPISISIDAKQPGHACRIQRDFYKPY